MADPNSIQFKVVLNKADQPVEIRKFTIGKDINYLYLRQKLYSIFPVLQSTGMTITWKDEDGDFIVIGSDEELLIALAEMPPYCKKIFVNVVSPVLPPRASSSESAPRAVHEGVVCDGCDSQIVGCRYRCLACPNYDLCSDCEQKGMHPEHVMLRCPYPISREFHFIKKIKKLHRKFAYHPTDAAYSHCHRGNRYDGSRAFRCPMVSENVHELVDDFVSALQSQVNIVTPELIQQVIESLSNLNLAGFNGTGNAEFTPDTATGENNGESSKKKKDRDDRAGKKRGCPFTERRSEERPDIAPPQLANLITSMMNQVGPNLMSVLNQIGSAASPRAQAGPATTTSAATGEPASSASAPEAAAASSSEPMVITLDEDSSADCVLTSPQPSEEPAAGAASAPPVASEGTSAQRPFDQLISRQLQTMLNMGFNNEGGWLKELLVAKNGDITKVLDQLLEQNKGPSRPNLSRLELD